MHQKNLFLLLPLPSVALGVLAMAAGGVSPVLWGQQVAAWLVFAALTYVFMRAAQRISAGVWSVILLLFLAITLFGREAGGARRWIDLVVFHVNAAHLVLPALLTLLCRTKNPSILILGAAVVLCIQPDVSQLAAFIAAALPILWRHEKKRRLALGCAIVLCPLLVVCSMIPVTLEPESFCEGILGMLRVLFWLLETAGWASLIAIPACFLYRFFRQGETQPLSLALYYAVMILFVLTGEYPVPFMGFGLSPIAGYYLALLLDAKKGVPAD